MRKVSVASLAIAGSLAAAPAFAHHGKDFLFVQTVQLPHPGEVYFVGSFDFLRNDDGNELEATPALLFGVTSNLALEAHGHVAHEDGEWSYESTAPGLRVQLPGEGPVRVGFAAEYEFAHTEGIADRLEGRLIVDYRRDRRGVSLNLIAERAMRQGQPTELGYAIGFRPDFEARLGWGVEAQGGLYRREGHEVLLGMYAEPSDRITLKLGAGRGFGDDLKWSVRTGFVFRF